MPSLNTTRHSLVLLAAIALAYIWLQVPTVQAYSLQVFALLIAGFLIYKRLRGAKFWHILPEHTSAEMAVLTFAFLLVIGATGNTESPFYPLAYLHIFFIVMTSHPVTAIIATTGITLFHFAVDGGPSIQMLTSISTLIIMLGVFVFAKQQYDENKKRKVKLDLEDKQLALLGDQERTLEDFMQRFLEPRITRLKELNAEPEKNMQTISTQLELIDTELKKVNDSVMTERSHSQQQSAKNEASYAKTAKKPK